MSSCTITVSIKEKEALEYSDTYSMLDEIAKAILDGTNLSTVTVVAQGGERVTR